MVYMRTELKEIERTGGSLLTPLFAKFPQDEKIEPNDVRTVMYGPAIKVDFTFKQLE